MAALSKSNEPVCSTYIMLIWQFKLPSSTFSSATTSLCEGFGLLSHFLPFNQILDAFCPIIYIHDFRSSDYHQYKLTSTAEHKSCTYKYRELTSDNGHFDSSPSITAESS
jgi:hypothetical protein